MITIISDTYLYNMYFTSIRFRTRKNATGSQQSTLLVIRKSKTPCDRAHDEIEFGDHR